MLYGAEREVNWASELKYTYSLIQFSGIVVIIDIVIVLIFIID